MELWYVGLTLLSPSSTDEADAGSCSPDEEARYYNKLVFLAQLTNLPENSVTDSERELPPYDFSLYALWNFRDVFEQNPETGSARTILLRGAALWMIHCADKLMSNVRAQRDFVHQASGTNPAQAGHRFRNEHKWAGFNNKRWTIWVQGLEHVNGESEDVMRLVEKALSEVKRIEKSSMRYEELES